MNEKERNQKNVCSMNTPERGFISRVHKKLSQIDKKIHIFLTKEYFQIKK